MLMVLVAMAICALSGVAGLAFPRGSIIGQRLADALILAGCALGLFAATGALTSPPVTWQIAWSIPSRAIFLHLDALAAFFLMPVFLVGGLGALYSEGYWPARRHPATARSLRCFYGALISGLVLVMIAGDAWSFLVAFEILGLAAFFLILTEQDKAEAQRAGWIYLVAAHASGLVLFAMFALLRSATGHWRITAPLQLSAPVGAAVVVLALIAFGIKAGVMPLHIWLPEAHAAAPSHVSAILSGVVLKLGIYGMVRILALVPVQSWFGYTLLAAGVISGVLGVVLALAQHDLKRLLAYHSIENIGIILIGLGLGWLGLQHHRPDVALLGFAGGLLHVWNHALFKALLFFAAGSVVHATGTRQIDALGGLLRPMRFTAAAFILGAVAISGLPPLNGFVSEFLIYRSSFQSVLGPAAIAGLFAAPALALIGALAVACFVKAAGAVFLGSPRVPRPEIHEASTSMKLAMGVLGAACIFIGVFPAAAVAIVHRVAGPMVPGSMPVQGLDSLQLVILILITLSAAGVALLAWLRASHAVTWDCGYAAPSPRMQYTASSFASILVRIFGWAVLPDEHRPRLAGPFPASDTFHSHVPDPVLDRVLMPGAHRIRQVLQWGRVLQTGRIQLYVLYIVVVLIVLIVWSVGT